MNNQQTLESTIINKYKTVAMDMLKHSFPYALEQEISDAIDYSIIKRMRNGDAVINNNYKKKKVNITLLELSDYILKREPIITSYGVMFKKHAECDNPIANLLDTFMKNRDIHKSKMFQYPKGSEMFERYNLLQLLAKVDANGFYGAMGQNSCLFYNIHVAASITMQGRSCISAAGLFFEMFLANNVKFASLDEVITFIHNVKSETNDRKYNDNDVLDRDITRDECFYKVMMTCGFDYVPDDEDLCIVWDIICNLSQQDINRLYYKNNLYDFMENKTMTNAIIYILQSMKDPYLDPRIGKVPKSISVELDMFKDILQEYVYYGHQILDRLEKYGNMIRSVCVITDTDSTIVSLDAWYRYILSKIENVPMEIKYEKMDIVKRLEVDEFNEMELVNVIERIEPETDYDFYNDEVVQMQSLLEPCKLIPQEGVRYSIINILAYCMSSYILDYMEHYTKCSHSYSEDRKCLIIMKNEFLFKRLLLIGVKKFYASIQELQEGNIINGGLLDIKGLPMVKKTLNKKSRDTLTKILYEEIMNADDINQVKIIKELAKFENAIFSSLSSGNKEYYKPLRIKSLSAYPNPMGQQGIKASVVWNDTRVDGLPIIDLSESNTIDVVKVIISFVTVEKIKDKYSEIYEKLISILSKPEFKGTITAIAIPKDSDVPKWVIDFIDYESIISDNAKYLPIESVGLHRTLASTTHTNILSI